MLPNRDDRARNAKPSVSRGSCAARVARCLSYSCRLRYPANFCAGDDLPSTRVGLRRHAFAGIGSSRGIGREVDGSVQRERLSGRFGIRGPGRQVMETFEFGVHPLQRRGEHLLAT